MKIWEHPLYIEDIERTARLPLPWDRLKGSGVLISGGSGMIGSFLADLLMYKNREEGLGCQVIVLGRNEKRLQDRFSLYKEDPLLRIFSQDVNLPLDPSIFEQKLDYIFHLASNTHPLQYATDPISTVTTTIIGTNNLLSLALELGIRRFVFASSVEIYGENRGDREYFTEDYCGYIDCNTMRAGYPESKRAGEALCQAYIRQKNLDIVIPRLSRTYGPSMLQSDTKAISQFIKKGVAREDIILKSEGTQYYSYSYVSDAVSGILYCFFFGGCGEAYKIADRASDTSLKDLAKIIAEEAGTKVVFEIPEETEREGYSKATKAVLDSGKLQGLGWRAGHRIQEGLKRTVQILRKSE